MVNDLVPSVRRETVKTHHCTGNAQSLWETLETSSGCQGSQGYVLDQHGPLWPTRKVHSIHGYRFVRTVWEKYQKLAKIKKLIETRPQAESG